MAFRIRGAASINGGNEPLFVVDGLPISTGLNNINPDEIESFSILKDAAATSRTIVKGVLESETPYKEITEEDFELLQ